MFLNNPTSTDEGSDDRYPCLTIDIPTLFTDRLGIRKRRLLPLLVFRSGNEFFVLEEVIVWMMDLVPIRPLKVLHGSVSTIGLLTAFYVVTGKPVLETGSDADLLIDSYLLFRLSPPEDPQQSLLPLWKPISGATLRKELRTVDSFVKSVRRSTRAKTPLTEALTAASSLFEQRIPKRYGKSFYTHLDSQWAQYKQLEGFTPSLPTYLRYLSRSPKVIPDENRTMTCEECDALIEATSNPSYRTLFEGAAGTGGRISEYAHMYRCDFVPAFYSKRLINTHSDDPLILFCDPVRSKWIGRWESREQTRETFLRRKYGLVPRNLSAEKKYRVGWKGMTFADHSLFRVPVWIDSARAIRFQSGVEEMAQVAKRSGMDVKTPYLFTGTGRGNHGEPLRIGNVEKAFQRSAEKLGLWGAPGIHIHGFRHFYVHYLRNELKFDTTLLQLSLGHEDERSSGSYGKDWQKAHDAAKAREAANAR